MKVYGIANCDTVKKARAWLDAGGIDYEWVDFRKAPPSPGDLSRWSRVAGWEKLVNRRGTTWRRLSPAQQASVTDAASAVTLMQAQPALIRRPLIERGAQVIVGFDADDYARLFGREA